MGCAEELYAGLGLYARLTRGVSGKISVAGAEEIKVFGDRKAHHWTFIQSVNLSTLASSSPTTRSR